MRGLDEIDDDHYDSRVDETIRGCLSLDAPESFFVFAGAGSGKTRSLVNAIKELRTNWKKRLTLRGQRIAVITFTNKACEEIRRRIDFDALVEVSTIHSFVWGLIEGFNDDIRKWLTVNLQEEIAELNALQAKSRGPNKTSTDRARKIESKGRRLAGLGEIVKFTYNPNGDNLGRDSLSHTEVIEIASDFLRREALMQQILISRFPVLLIDESQDTKGRLLEALMEVQQRHRSSFTLGLFGDRMQQIYNEGKADLGEGLPSDWKTPIKKMNHRCPKRVVDLINRIRAPIDAQEQRARRDADPGVVRLFIVPGGDSDKMELEDKVCRMMAEFAGDPCWDGDGKEVKILILEHHMAARRMGFQAMFEPLYRSDKLKTGLLDGTLPELKLFSDCVEPVVSASIRGDDYTVAAVMRKRSPLLTAKFLKESGDQQLLRIREARDVVAELCGLWSNGAEPTFRDVLKVVVRTGLFPVSVGLRTFVGGEAEESGEETEAEGSEQAEQEEEGSSTTDTTSAWNTFLDTPYSQIKPYRRYIDGLAGFDTHQGVKGLEFPRVMVVMDDTEARGFMFSYEKLFGAKAKTATDIENERSGKDTGINRTKRLFYVTCSRAMKSLALVAYSGNPTAVRNQVIRDGWFSDEEVISIGE